MTNPRNRRRGDGPGRLPGNSSSASFSFATSSSDVIGVNRSSSTEPMTGSALASTTQSSGMRTVARPIVTKTSTITSSPGPSFTCRKSRLERPMSTATRPLRTSERTLELSDFPMMPVVVTRGPETLVQAVLGMPNDENIATTSRNRKKHGTPPLPGFAAAGLAGLNACATRLAPNRTMMAGQYFIRLAASWRPIVSSSSTMPTAMMVKPITRFGVRNMRSLQNARARSGRYFDFADEDEAAQDKPRRRSHACGPVPVVLDGDGPHHRQRACLHHPVVGHAHPRAAHRDEDVNDDLLPGRGVQLPKDRKSV